ncbi:uncharacterized protein LOC128829215 isoform X3 [Malaclemys terrapin pileata]|uniref:uncharacterized protein LOC128829215 isoform X3 n=1 Tax=Malaclemys terrapin pileata TaxID=2991368 RepID=UPI0023A8D812|nr:uncharacterized protein LOC128829215 isoform X3 [Malaclemys terrapin pileata]
MSNCYNLQPQLLSPRLASPSPSPAVRGLGREGSMTAVLGPPQGAWAKLPHCLVRWPHLHGSVWCWCCLGARLGECPALSRPLSSRCSEMLRYFDQLGKRKRAQATNLWNEPADDTHMERDDDRELYNLLQKRARLRRGSEDRLLILDAGDDFLSSARCYYPLEAEEGPPSEEEPPSQEAVLVTLSPAPQGGEEEEEEEAAMMDEESLLVKLIE